ncbi:MAG: four helix bundle protein [Planctomycetes bacterium]|nr:four helix bundle protein [Planctomycetota bacterium]
MDPIKTTVRERSKRLGSIRRFEDLIAWQKARELTRAVYQSTGHGAFSQDFGLKRQIQRAAVSVMSNIAEGFERHRPREFHQFLSIAKSSCAELRSQLYVACDVGYLDRSDFERFMNQAEEVARIIGGLRASLAIDK